MRQRFTSLCYVRFCTVQAKNCFITPHIAWAPLETRERLLRITVDNLNAYLSGEAKNVIG